MVYRLGVDVGGAFTGLLRLYEESGRFWRQLARAHRLAAE